MFKNSVAISWHTIQAIDHLQGINRREAAIPADIQEASEPGFRCMTIQSIDDIQSVNRGDILIIVDVMKHQRILKHGKVSGQHLARFQRFKHECTMTSLITHIAVSCHSSSRAEL